MAFLAARATTLGFHGKDHKSAESAKETESKMKEYECEVCVIGAGPGGLPSAVRSAQKGFKTICIERMAHVGGCCVNEGCVPTKSMCHVTSTYTNIKVLCDDDAAHHFQHAHERGIHVDGVRLDLDEVHRQKDAARLAQQLNMENVLTSAGVQLVKGNATIISPHEIKVTALNPGQEDAVIKVSKNIILATGSHSTPLPSLPFDHKNVLDSFDTVELKKIPKKMLVVGAGVIALELGSVWSRLGTDVTMVEILPTIGSTQCDPTTSAHAKEIFERQGMKFLMEHKVLGGTVENDSVKVKLADKSGAEITMDVDAVLVSIGRRPNTSGLGLENVGVSINRAGYVEVDEYCNTSVKNIYAVGDITNKGYMVAHKATMEAHAVTDTISGNPTTLRYDRLPCCVYTKPELAWCGKPQAVWEASGTKTKAYIFKFHSSMRDPLAEHLDGFIKVITDAATSEILSMSAVGETAGDLIGEGVMAMVKHASISEWGHVPHVHPFYKSFHTMYLLGIYDN